MVILSQKKTINKCVWLRMARMEMDSNLKTPGRLFFQFCALMSQTIILVKTFLSKFIQFCFLSSLKAIYVLASYFDINLVNL